MGSHVKTTYAPKGMHRGFIILLVTTTWETRFRTDSSCHYQLCKDDSTTLQPWKRGKNRLFTYATDFERIKRIADDIADQKLLVYTDADRAKYVSNYNKRNGWGFSKKDLLSTMRQHKNGNAVMKRLMEDRLEDANFHGYCGDLAENNYTKFLERIKDDERRGFF